jgi:hypothetical protein
MPWVIIFIMSWLLFFIFIDYSRLKDNIAGGVLSIGLATIVDSGAQHLQLYKFCNLIIPWIGLPAPYIFGPIFTMGILFIQFVPRNKWLQFLHILIFALIFAAVDYLTVLVQVAKYFHWHWLASFFFNTVTFAGLTWVTIKFIWEKE